MKNYITPKGLKRLQDEYDFLVKLDRPKTVEVVKWAASLGDRSENADYQYGKKRLREIDKRLRFLSQRLKLAEVVDPVGFKSQKIQFGATVELESIEGEIRTVSIVGVDESSPRDGRVSWQSPLGKSLIGKEVGDDVSVQTPSGVVEYSILQINYCDIRLPAWEAPELKELKS